MIEERGCIAISLFKVLRNLFFKRGKGGKKGNKKEISGSEEGGKRLSSKLAENLAFFKEVLRDCEDVVFREWRFGSNGEFSAAIIFVEGLVDKNMINEEILKSLMLEARQTRPERVTSREELYRLVVEAALSAASVKQVDDYDKAIFHLMSGMVVFLIDGFSRAILVEAKGWEHRGVQEPETETVIRGPRDGFCETLRVNTALIRRRIRDPNLKLKVIQVGRRTKTDVALLYMAGIVEPDLFKEVKERLDKIDMDAVLESGYLEQLIEDTWLSPFPQLQGTERPDEVAAGLLEGRVAILTDNTPFALLIPATLNSLMHSPEDHYERWLIGTFIRLIRFAANFIALVLPSLYISLTSFHPEMLPTRLTLSIAASREGVPFPAFVEAFLMESALELLREAGVRLPGPIGQTLGIVGGLIIGEAAVSASLVSSIMVIVVAVTAISSFAAPTFDVAIAFRLLRFVLMIMASILGLYGVVLGLMLILSHLAALKSFGVSYLSPWSPLTLSDLKDSLLRSPMMTMHKRPSFLSTGDPDRMDDERAERRSPRAKRSGGDR